MSEFTLYVGALIISVVGATLSVLIASRRLKPLHGLVERIEPKAQAPSILNRWRVAIDARPMIGHFDGSEYRVYGIGHYLRNLVEEIAAQDHSTQYVLWSSSFKGNLPTWYRELIHSHSNFKAVHLKLPNAIVDRVAYYNNFRFIHELVGSVNVSYDANYFQIKPYGAYSICNVSDLSFRDSRNQWTNRFQERAAWTSGSADKITTLSHASKRRILAEVSGVRSDDVDVIYAAAAAMFSPAFAERTQATVAKKHQLPSRYFLYMGEPAGRKNLRTLVEAFRRVRRDNDDIHLIVTGCGQDELTSSLKDVDLSGTTALGYVPTEDLPAIYRSSMALVYPSKEEGFGMPVVEAMRTGQIVVISQDAALAEVAGQAAIGVDAAVEPLESAMRRILRMTDRERTHHINAGFERSARYSWAESARQLLRLFEIGMQTRSKGRSQKAIGSLQTPQLTRKHAKVGI